MGCTILEFTLCGQREQMLQRHNFISTINVISLPAHPSNHIRYGS